MRPRKNKYDDEIVEYWVDYRTQGVLGVDERQSIRESSETQGRANQLELGPDGFHDWSLPDPGVCEIEDGGARAAKLQPKICA